MHIVYVYGMSRYKYLLSAIVLFVIAIATYQFGGNHSFVHESVDSHTQNNMDTAQVEPVVKYGLPLSDFEVMSHVVKSGELFSDILTKYNVATGTIHSIAATAKGIFSFNKIKAGQTCTVLCEKTDSQLVAKKLIYEESKVSYVVFNLDDSLYIYRGKYAVERKTQTAAGIIQSSLYETLEKNNISPVLAIKMAEIFAWTIDFYKLQKGDKFKVIYDEDFAENESIGIGEVKGIVFSHGGKEHHAYYFEKDPAHVGEYYDENGNSMRKQFLKSPVKFSRISSKFSMRRFHPVTNKWKAHLGTDYAAPHGTPILATADGVVEEAQYKSNNGNYVKIKHNGQYKTQYLHMSKIGTGIRKGARVKQGDVIGYVGSTGLATGPHVCYRFWKDGQQVDPLKQKLSYSDPLPANYKTAFLKQVAPYKKMLSETNWNGAPSTTTVVEAVL